MPSAVAASARIGPDLFRGMIDRLPTAAYACDADGLITYYNDKAAELWGRAPRLEHEDDRFCGSHRLFSADGAPIQHDECWMALALQHRRDYLAREILVERPNAALVPVLAYAAPLVDDDGELVAGINLLVDISERKRMERLLKDANAARGQYMGTLAGELRTQLDAMRQTIAGLGADGASAAPPELTAALHAQVLEMAALVDDLLDVPQAVEEALEAAPAAALQPA